MGRMSLLLLVALLAVACGGSPPAALPPPEAPAGDTPATATTGPAGAVEAETPEPPPATDAPGQAAATDPPAAPKAAPTDDPQQPRVRLDGPAETYSLSESERSLPPGVLREIEFHVAGGGDGQNCGGYNEPTAVEDGGPTEWSVSTFVDLCGWAAGEEVRMTVTDPAGTVVFEDTLTASDMTDFDLDDAFDGDAFDGNVRFRFTPKLNAPLGDYAVHFSGPTGTLDHTITVAAPDGPRVYWHDGRIVLYQFEPQETVRILAYEPLTTQNAGVGPDTFLGEVYAFSTWNEYVTDDRGQLIVEGFLGNQFAVVGERSGEVPHTPLDQVQVTASSAVSLLRPSDEEMTTAADIWTLLPFVDLDAPGQRRSELAVSATETVQWRMRWCAVDSDTLRANLDAIAMRFLVNDVPVYSPQLRTFLETHPQTGWACHRWATLVTNWPTAQPTVLVIDYELSEAVNDGRQVYPAGVYRQVITVSATAAGSAAAPPAAPPAAPGQFYDPPRPAYASFTADTTSPTPDDVRATVQTQPSRLIRDTRLRTDGPELSPTTPSRLEPRPDIGPEFWGMLVADTCGWPQSGRYPVAITYPDGTTQLDPLFDVDINRGCNRYQEILIPPVLLGTYTLQFGTYENMRQEIELVAPEGARLYVIYEGNRGSISLVLHNFAPGEPVRVYEYRPDPQAPDVLALVGWQALQTDDNGQLHVGTDYCVHPICPENDPAQMPTFFVVGDVTGVVGEFDQLLEGPHPSQSILGAP